MRILLALDASSGAIDEAVRLASERGAGLTALFVTEAGWETYIGSDWQSSAKAWDGFLDSIRAGEDQAAKEAADALRERLCGFPCDLKVVTGDVAQEIEKELAQGYDLLVMAHPFTRGLSVVRKPVERLLKRATCSLYLVRDAT